MDRDAQPDSGRGERAGRPGGHHRVQILSQRAQRVAGNVLQLHAHVAPRQHPAEVHLDHGAHWLHSEQHFEQLRSRSRCAANVRHVQAGHEHRRDQPRRRDQHSSPEMGGTKRSARPERSARAV